MKFLLSYFKQYKLQLAGVFLALMVSAGAVLSFGRWIKLLIDQGFARENSAMLDHALLLLLTAATVLSLAAYIRYYLITRIGDSVVANIRRDVFRHLINFSPAFFETEKTGSIISRLTTDTVLIQSLITTVFSQLIRNGLTFTGGLILLFVTSPKLTLYVLVIVPLAVLPIVILGKKVRKLSAATQLKIGDISAHIEETVSSYKTVQAYCREALEAEKFEGYLQNALAASQNRIKMRAALTAMVILLTFAAVGLVLWIGGHEVLAGEMTAGGLSAFIFYAVMLAGALGAISDVVGELQRALGATDGLSAIISVGSKIKDSADAIALPDNTKGELEFRDVTFFYPNKKDKPALKNVNFRARAGEKIAIVGLSGAGKSTIFQLALRFYDPTYGKILCDGIDVKDLQLKSLRSEFAIVSQEPFIFSGTARENIGYGREGATEAEIIAAAKAAMAYDFIMKLPQGFDTYLGEKGMRISGGERQRIAIARAILRAPKILLLDEATNALDAENEQMVQLALEKLMNNCTTIIIAHRLATVLKSDRILVLNEGKIEEEGNHQQLITASGLYSRLAGLQFGLEGMDFSSRSAVSEPIILTEVHKKVMH